MERVLKQTIAHCADATRPDRPVIKASAADDTALASPPSLFQKG